MTDDIVPLTHDEIDQALAAELALGLLDGDEAADAVARLSHDAAFAQMVRDWQELLAGLALSLTPVMAPAGARHRIRERLGHAVQPLSVDPNARAPWWRRPIWALGGLVAAVALVVGLWLPQRPVPQGDNAPQAFHAQLSSADQPLRVLASLDGHQMRVELQEGTPPDGRDWEVWWIAPDAETPVSLGILPRDEPLRVTLADDAQPSAQIQIALTDEPAGGSPSGLPTGPVVAAAPLTAL